MGKVVVLRVIEYGGLSIAASIEMEIKGLPPCTVEDAGIVRKLRMISYRVMRDITRGWYYVISVDTENIEAKLLQCEAELQEAIKVIEAVACPAVKDIEAIYPNGMMKISHARSGTFSDPTCQCLGVHHSWQGKVFVEIPYEQL